MQFMPLSQDWAHFTYEVVNFEVMKEDVTDLVTFYKEQNEWCIMQLIYFYFFS